MSLGAQVAIAVADTVPKLNVGPSCGAARIFLGALRADVKAT
jgi:hypothetical protein